MRLRFSPRVARSRFSIRQNHRILSRTIQTKILSLLIVVSLPIWPTGFALPQVPVSAPDTAALSVAPLGYLPLLLKSLLWLVGPATQQDTLDSRASAVARLRITPIKSVAYIDQVITFSALPTDSLSRPVQGAKPSWQSSNPLHLSISESGRATAILPGLVG